MDVVSVTEVGDGAAALRLGSAGEFVQKVGPLCTSGPKYTYLNVTQTVG
jgi:hypothetical protein